LQLRADSSHDTGSALAEHNCKTCAETSLKVVLLLLLLLVVVVSV
jgi:hypothetical protein